jgi:mediator of DNA damage checkpoint protein 1
VRLLSPSPVTSKTNEKADKRPQFYSPDPIQLFSGVVACATDLPAVDLEVLSGGITALGGQWRTGLTKEVTHLFAIQARPPVDENA